MLYLHRIIVSNTLAGQRFFHSNFYMPFFLFFCVSIMSYRHLLCFIIKFFPNAFCLVSTSGKTIESETNDTLDNFPAIFLLKIPLWSLEFERLNEKKLIQKEEIDDYSYHINIQGNNFQQQVDSLPGSSPFCNFESAKQ